MKILLLTNHYPKHDADPSGCSIKRWKEGLEKFGHEIFLQEPLKAGSAEVIVCHWLYPWGLIGALLSFLYRKPLYLVLHGCPYMVERYWWVRLIGGFALRRASTIQVASWKCYWIMERYYPDKRIVKIPCL